MKNGKGNGLNSSKRGTQTSITLASLSDHAHEDEDGEEEDEGELLLNEGRYKKSIIDRCLPLVECVLIILFQVLIVLYLDGYPVYLPCILAPYYGFEVTHSLFNGKSGWVTRLVILIQLTCIVLYHKNWVTAFIPTYLLGLFYFLKLWGQYRHFAKMGNQELAQQAKSLVFAATILYCLLATLFYTVLGLIIARLKGIVQIRLIVILIPIFIIMVRFFYNKPTLCICELMTEYVCVIKRVSCSAVVAAACRVCSSFLLPYPAMIQKL